GAVSSDAAVPGAAARRKHKLPSEGRQQGERAEPSEAARAFETEFEVSPEQARLLSADPALALFFREAHAVHPRPKALANWIATELLRELKERSIADLPFAGAA